MSIQHHAAQVHHSFFALQGLALRLTLPEHSSKHHRVAWALLRLAFDHSVSITDNFYHHGSSRAGLPFALLRPMNDAMKRGAWFALCATEQQAVDFLDCETLPKQSTIVESLENCSPFNSSPFFSQQFEVARTKFNDFTHGGKVVVGAYLSGHGIGAAFSERDVHEILSYVEVVAMVAVQVMANVGAQYDPEIADQVIIAIGNMDWSGHQLPR